MNKLIVALLIITMALSCKVSKHEGASRPITHEQWTQLLQKHVSDAGNVDYEGFIQDSVAFQEYLSLLSNHHPNDTHWTQQQQLAYWINAYNAFTVQLIVDHYPIDGIKEIKGGVPFVNSVWDIKFINIEDRTYDLNNIEHGILRKHFEEPRIHFAINCASVSCPALLNEAYISEHIEEQLDLMAVRFINDLSRNEISAEKIKISKIFKWFSGDFKKKGDLKTFLNKYANTKINDYASIDYLDYNWNLNN